MTMIPLSYLSGVCKVNSPYASSAQGGGGNGREAVGRFTDMDGFRFVAGFPEVIMGLTTDNFGGATIVGRFCGLAKGRDFSGNSYIWVGTDLKLYSYKDNTLTDITPLRGTLSSTLSNPFDTTNGSATVNVNHTAHGLSTGNYVLLVGGAAVGGLTIAGIYTNITVTGVDDYTITASSNATSTVSGGGGTTSYTYYRVTLSNPFNTTISSATVTVNHTGHGAKVNDYVKISGASAVGGITPSGDVKVVTIPNANSWTFTWTSSATSSVTGGGSPNFQYDSTNPRYLAQNTSPLNLQANGAVWSLANYGQQLLANPTGGGVYIWDPTIGGRAYPMYNAPTSATAMFVTSERFVFALGTSSNPLLVQWADQDDYTDWTSTATNTANSRTLQKGSFLMGGIAVRDGVSLVFTDSAAYAFNYTGDNFVYNSTLAGSECGLIGPLGVTVMGNAAYWMSRRDFWRWDGAVQKLPSDDIRDYIFSNMATLSANFNSYRLSVAGAHSGKSEVWFFYPNFNINANYNSSNVIFHVDQSCWSIGSTGRLAWVDNDNITPYGISNGLPGPISAMSYGNAKIAYIDAIQTYFQNSYIDTFLGPLFVTFSPIDVSRGERNMDVFAFYPDKKRQNESFSLVMQTQQYPGDTAVSGTYALGTNTNRVDLRLGAKLVGYQVSYTGTATAADIRLGLPRIEAQPSGSRR